MNKQQAGGLSTFQKYGREYMRAIGSRGGLTTVARHGREHMASIGRRGAARFYELYDLVPCDLAKFAIVTKSTHTVIAVM